MRMYVYTHTYIYMIFVIIIIIIITIITLFARYSIGSDSPDILRCVSST